MGEKHPSYGPLDREQIAKLTASPYGVATETIRQHDPEWGRAPGEKFEWEVTVRRDADGVALVKAANKKEAEELAYDLTGAEIDWETDDDDFDIVSVKAVIPKRRLAT